METTSTAWDHVLTWDDRSDHSILSLFGDTSDYNCHIELTEDLKFDPEGMTSSYWSLIILCGLGDQRISYEIEQEFFSAEAGKAFVQRNFLAICAFADSLARLPSMK